MTQTPPALPARFALALIACLAAIGCSSPVPADSQASQPAASRPAASQPAASQPLAEGTTVILLRHAEKAPDPGDGDPDLSERGAARAQALVGALDGVPVDAIYATQYKRTQETVQPLAKARGLQVTVHDAGDTLGLLELIRAYPGQTVVVCGHGDTLPAIAEALGAERLGKVEYGKLYEVQATGGETHLDVETFGD
jgi:broad specificity phosphatase PhoE